VRQVRQQLDITETAEIFVKSGMFPDLKSVEQAATKLIIGRGYGISDYDSITGLYIRQGKLNMHANLMAAAIKASGKYDYEVVEQTDEQCSVQFFRVEPGIREPIGRHTFTMEQAHRANLTKNFTWKQYPEAMLFARCISAGYRAHCPDALGAAPVYVEQHGEMEVGDQQGGTVPAQRAVPETESTTVDEAEENAIREEHAEIKSVRAHIVEQVEQWADMPREEAVQMAVKFLEHMGLPTDGSADEVDLGIILSWILDLRREGVNFEDAITDRIDELTNAPTPDEGVELVPQDRENNIDF